MFSKAIDEGYDIMAPIPSCVLMYKQELPLMFPTTSVSRRCKRAFFDPFEYLMLRHKAGLVEHRVSHRAWARWRTTSPAINGCRASA